MNDYIPPTVTNLPDFIVYPTDDYPPEWGVIATTIKRMARWRCENCDHVHDVANGYMLTVHHLNMQKNDCRWQNIVALCQRCHLRIQATYNPTQPRLIGSPPKWAAVRNLP